MQPPFPFYPKCATLNPYGHSGELEWKDSVKSSPQSTKACCSVRSHLQIFTPANISLWNETLFYGLNKRISWEKNTAAVKEWVSECGGLLLKVKGPTQEVYQRKRGWRMYTCTVWSIIEHVHVGVWGIYAICSLLHSPGDFCLSPLRTWSPPGHGLCLVKAIRTRRGLSLKVIKKRTCWLGEKPAIRFLRATFFSCAGCIQRSV